MTLKEFLDLDIIYGNVVIIKKRVCSGKCEGGCCCVLHPLVKIIRNSGKIVDRELIIKKGRGDLLDEEVLQVYALGGTQTCIIVSG